jgi:antirestriction protein ArdC
LSAPPKRLRAASVTRSYAKEELVAEISSWMTALQTGIQHNPEQNAA